MQICTCLRLRARGVDCLQRGIGNFCGDGHVTVLDWGDSSTALYNCPNSTNYTLKMRGLYSFYTLIGEKWKKSQPMSSSSWQQDIGTYFKCPSYSYHGPLYKWVNLFFNSTVGHLQGFFLLIGSMGLRHFCTNLWSTFASISYKLRYQFRWVIEYVHFSNIYKHVWKPHCSTSLPILGMIRFKNFKSAGLISLELAFLITNRVEIFFSCLLAMQVCFFSGKTLGTSWEAKDFWNRDNDAGKNRRLQEKRKTEPERDWLHKRSHRHKSTGAE